MLYRALALAAGVALLAPARALAEETRFLGKAPHGPLALVRGRLQKPGKGACRAWGRPRQAWLALGKLGEVVGEARVTKLERYDVTNCDEFTLRGVRGGAGAGVFVRGRYAPLALEAWGPSAADRAALARRIGLRDALAGRGRPASRDREDLPLDARLITFRTPTGRRYAVVGGRALSILRLDGHGWVEEHRDLPAPAEASPGAERYMPVAVLDMDGDGSFEVVVHHKENEGEWYGDDTLTRGRAGWVRVEAGIYGSTA